MLLRCTTLKLIPFTCQWSSNKREKGDMAVQVSSCSQHLTCWLFLRISSLNHYRAGLTESNVVTNDQRADAFRDISCPCSSLHLLLRGMCFFSSFIPPCFESWPEAVGWQLVAYSVAEGMQCSLAAQLPAREDRFVLGSGTHQVSMQAFTFSLMWYWWQAP